MSVPTDEEHLYTACQRFHTAVWLALCDVAAAGYLDAAGVRDAELRAFCVGTYAALSPVIHHAFRLALTAPAQSWEKDTRQNVRQDAPGATTDPRPHARPLSPAAVSQGAPVAQRR
jgi:hypothetical protein